MKLKIVPDSDPKADGRWIDVPNRMIKWAMGKNTIQRLELTYKDIIPNNHHVASYDL